MYMKFTFRRVPQALWSLGLHASLTYYIYIYMHICMLYMRLGCAEKHEAKL